ncbi:MAG: hypothetical protein ACFFD6_03950 [Candidatus Thorarchaeota archaeon]
MKTKKEKVIKYGKWEAFPHIRLIPLAGPTPTHPEMIGMTTKHEGVITYYRFWNFWVRVGTPATRIPDAFFYDFENGSSVVWDLINDVGAPTAWPRTQEEIWDRITTVWNWLRDNVRYDGDAYASIASDPNRWPSIRELAQYYADHGELVWAACFSKAHLFATLLGRVLPRWHTIIASAHHTEGGAPPTASHVYTGVYLSDRWFYLDPSFVNSIQIPDFQNKSSIGQFSTVDYEHPFSAIPVRLSPLDRVPYLPK